MKLLPFPFTHKALADLATLPTSVVPWISYRRSFSTCNTLSLSCTYIHSHTFTRTLIKHTSTFCRISRCKQSTYRERNASQYDCWLVLTPKPYRAESQKVKIFFTLMCRTHTILAQDWCDLVIGNSAVFYLAKRTPRSQKNNVGKMNYHQAPCKPTRGSLGPSRAGCLTATRFWCTGSESRNCGSDK